MNTTQGDRQVSAGFREPTTPKTAPAPSAFLEYTWFGSLAYAMLGQVWGIAIPAIGGVMLLVIAAGCFMSVASSAIRIYQPIAWAFCTGVLGLAIQFIFHDAGADAWSETIAIVSWLALLVIVQALALRPQFLLRFALVALGIGVLCLPYLKMANVGGVVRTWGAGGLANPNVLGMWFGFCAVYYIFAGLQYRGTSVRLACWTAAVGCLFIVMLTVSRAPLAAVALACIVGFRSALKGSFVPLLALALLLGLVYASGIFDNEIGYYESRGAEESGRGKLWPAALERIFNSPWAGVGLDDIKIRVGPKFVNPHNGLLHIALGTGIVTLICFIGYLARVGIGTLRIMQRVQEGEAAVLPPLVVYALFEMMVLDYAFMSPWSAVVFGLAAAASQNPIRRRTVCIQREGLSH